MIIVKNRVLKIPNDDRYIGTVFDRNAEVKKFQISRIAANGVDLSALVYTLDILYEDGRKDSDFLKKEIQDDFIILTWDCSRFISQGTIFINIRATDSKGTVKWASNRAALYVSNIVDTPSNNNSTTLTELEKYEVFIQQSILGIKQVSDVLEEKVNVSDARSSEALSKVVQALSNIQSLSNSLESEFLSYKTSLNELFNNKSLVIEQRLVDSLNNSVDEVKGRLRQKLQEITQATSELEANYNLTVRNLESNFNRRTIEIERYNLRMLEDIKIDMMRMESDISVSTQNIINRINEESDAAFMELDAGISRINEALLNLKSKVDRGDFIGKNGKDGANGVVINIGSNNYAFQIDESNGHLYLIHEDGVDVPDFQIDDRGHLILNID